MRVGSSSRRLHLSFQAVRRLKQSAGQAFDAYMSWVSCRNDAMSAKGRSYSLKSFQRNLPSGHLKQPIGLATRKCYNCWQLKNTCCSSCTTLAPSKLHQRHCVDNATLDSAPTPVRLHMPASHARWCEESQNLAITNALLVLRAVHPQYGHLNCQHSAMPALIAQAMKCQSAPACTQA